MASRPAVPFIVSTTWRALELQMDGSEKSRCSESTSCCIDDRLARSVSQKEVFLLDFDWSKAVITHYSTVKEIVRVNIEKRSKTVLSTFKETSLFAVIL